MELGKLWTLPFDRKQDHRTLEGKLELCKLISSFALHVSGRIKFQSLIGFVYIVYNQ